MAGSYKIYRLPDFDDEVDDIDQDGLREKVEAQIEELEADPEAVIWGEKELGLGQYSYNQETIHYLKPSYGSDQFRVYFTILSRLIVCLKGWQKQQQDIPERIKRQVYNRLEGLKDKKDELIQLLRG
jgi:hypothetical protein